jgi:hypothetical protein
VADIAVGNMINRFIPEELAIAPGYPAGTPPHLTLREVSIDGNTSVQIWSPKSDAILLPEEVNLLRSDRLRVEVICSRLVWLLGANCSENDDYLGASDKLIYQWEDVTYFAGKYGFVLQRFARFMDHQSNDSAHICQTPRYNGLWNPPAGKYFSWKLNPWLGALRLNHAANFYRLSFGQVNRLVKR